MLEAVRLRWQVDKAGYKLGGNSRNSITNALRPTIRPISNQYQTYEVGLLQQPIFTELANTEQTAESALAFTNKWGSLNRTPSRLRNVLIGAGVDLDDFYEGRLEIISAIQAGKRGATALSRHIHARAGKAKFYLYLEGGLGPLNTYFEKGKLFFEAKSLLQFCLLQCVHASAGGIGVSGCGACGAYLHIPHVGRPKLYCNDACKQDAYRQRHKPASRRSDVVIVREHTRPQSIKRTKRKVFAL